MGLVGDPLEVPRWERLDGDVVVEREMGGMLEAMGWSWGWSLDWEAVGWEDGLEVAG